MEEPIVIRYRWTAEELLRATRYFWRSMFGLRLRLILFGWAALLAAVSFWVGLSFVTTWLFLVVLFYVFFLSDLTLGWAVRRKFKQRPDRDVEIEWRVTEEQLRIRSKLSDSEVAWEIFAKGVIAPDGVLLCPNNQIFHWLPREGFASDAEFGRFLELAKSKVPKIREIR